MKKYLLSFGTVAILSGFSSLFAQQPSIARPLIAQQPGKASLSFIENKGQWISQVKYKADIPGGVMFLTDQGFVYNYVSEKDMERFQEQLENGGDLSKGTIRHHAYKVNFVGASSNITYQGLEKRSNYNNYIIGNDPSKWAGHVGLYGKVAQQNIYNGIDLAIYSKKNISLKYDFIVAPGANPNSIILSFDGVNPVLTKEGDLNITTTVNKVMEHAPYTYQVINGQTVPVQSKYKLKNGQLSFEFPHGYNTAFPLIIDPNLVFATFSGGTGSSPYYAHSTTYDDEGNTYACALAYSGSTGWPTTTGAYMTNYPGPNSVALNKYSSDGSTLLFSTYFGASGGSTEPNTIRITDSHEMVLAGSTSASNLPVTTGAYQTSFAGGGNDIYVSKLSADGATLLASTYVGGSGLDATTIGDSYTYTDLGSSANPRNPVEVAFDANGNTWVTANSNSSNFPVTANAAQSTLGGNFDAVIFKLNDDFSNLLYSTYLGGNGWDGGIGLEKDPDGDMVVAGMSSSSNFPTTSGALHPTNNGGEDGFVTKINSSTGAILAATYLGTSSTDDAERLDFDCAGNVFVAGRSLGGSYPISTGAWNVPNGYVYVQKLTSDLSTSIYSTRLGASNSTIIPSAFMVDMCGNVVIGTVTSASNQTGMPLTTDAFQTNSSPFYLAVIGSHFDELEFGSFFGTSSDHFHPGVSRLDKDGVFYQSVCYSGYGNAWPTTLGAYSHDKMNGTTNDCVTFKFNFDAVSIGLKEATGSGGNDTIPHCVRGCKSAYFDFSRRHADTIPLTIHYLIGGSAVRGQDYQWIPDSIVIPAYDTVATLEIKPLIVTNMPTGMRDVIISALSPCGCDNGSQNVVRVGTVRIYDSLFVKIPTPLDTVCSNTPIVITADIDTSLNFQWEPAALIPDPLPLGLTIHPVPVHTTTYSITVTQPDAPATCPPHKVSYTSTVEPIPQILLTTKDTTVCLSDSIDLNVYGKPLGTDYNFLWTPAAHLRQDDLANNKFYAPVGDYKYVITATTPWALCQSKDSFMIHVVPPFQFSSVTPADTLIKRGDSVQLHARGDADFWLWSPVTYLSDPTLEDPTARPLKSTLYTLVGWDKYGCKDTAYVNINVEYQSTVIMPNAFSPNGDGRNDVFKIEGLKDEKLISFKIFNRLGQLIFDAKSIDKGWDGTINGKPAPLDTYFYDVKLALPDGTHKDIKGDLTLVR